MASAGPIDFLVIGAPKAGTTSLFEYLRGHPEIDLPPDKEVPYFSNDRNYASWDWDEYLRRAFPTPKRGRLSGTITPQYMSAITGVAEPAPGEARASAAYESGTLPRRIHERLPAARLIAILRDPVERAHSHHTQETRTGHETRPFAAMVEELLQPQALAECRRESTRTNGYVVLGEYGRLLEGYYDLYPRERILVLFTGDLAREPLGVLRRIYEFLGVEDLEPRNLGKRYNVSGAEPKVRRDLPAELVRIASGNLVTRRIWHSLSAERRSAVLSAYRRLNFRFADWNRRGAKSADRPSAEDAAALERLREHYAEDGVLLEKLLGYSPPWGTAGEAPAGGSGATEEGTGPSPEALRK